MQTSHWSAVSGVVSRKFWKTLRLTARKIEAIDRRVVMMK